MTPKVIILGLGYIGLPTAALIASRAIDVHGVDVDENVVQTINKGKTHIIEPDLEGLVIYSTENGYLRAHTQVASGDVFIIAVPTPLRENNQPDISYVNNAFTMIIPHLKAGNLIILESTSPVGTTESMAEQVFRERPDLVGQLFIAYCPERVLPGKVIYELQYNDRVIGGIDQKSTEKAEEFYELFVKSTLHKTNARTAEMCKLVENAYRDINIAFANELSMICDQAQVNVWQLIGLANKHPRVEILYPGPGVGGHCIAVDPWFLISHFEKAKVMKTAREVNNEKSDWVFNKIKDAARSFSKPKIACLGLTYKANIDDLRESPALYVTEKLMLEGLDILAVEPYIKTYRSWKIYDCLAAIEQADIVVYLVAHREFSKTLSVAASKVVLDFCGICR